MLVLQTTEIQHSGLRISLSFKTSAHEKKEKNETTTTTLTTK